MSKKAKKVKKSTRKRATAAELESVQCVANNYQSLAQHWETKADELEAEVRKVTAQADESSKRTVQRVEECMRLRGTIDDLKKIVAGLEREVAERDGTVRELRRQIDQAAPKVMIKPAVFVSPGEAKHQEYRADASLLRNMEAEMRSPKKHWTAL